MKSEMNLYHVQFVVPPTEERRWAQNNDWSVLAANLERAIDLIRERFTNCTITAVNKKSKGDVLVDPYWLVEQVQA